MSSSASSMQKDWWWNKGTANSRPPCANQCPRRRSGMCLSLAMMLCQRNMQRHRLMGDVRAGQLSRASRREGDL